MESRVKLARVLATAWIAVWLIAWPAQAHAIWMAVFGAVGGILGVSTVVAGIIVVGGLFVLNKITGGGLFGGSKRNARQQSKQGLMVNKQSNNEPITLAYGRMRTGGTRVFVETSDGSGVIGSGKKYLNVVLALTEGQMGDIKKLYFNDTVVWDAAEEGTFTGSDISGYTLADFRPEGTEADPINKYNGHVEVQYFVGHQDQDVSSLIQDSVDVNGAAGVWTSEHRLRSVAYLALKLEANQKAFGGSVPTVTAEIAGKKIVDVNATTDFSSPVYVTPGANQNPVDVLYDILTNVDYGKGLTHADIDTTSFKSTWTHANGLFKIDGYFDTADKLYDNIEELLDACNGFLVYINGKYKLHIRQRNETAVQTIDYDDIIGEIKITKNTKEKQINKISITWNNPNATTKYNEDLLVTANSTYLAIDNGTILEANTENLLVTDVTLLQKLADFKIDASRHQMTTEFVGSHRLMNIEPGSIININNAELGFTNKPFRVLSTSITNDNNIEFICGVYVSDIEVA
tara:strand:+ start:2363 stop:3913 length:1551 start_codon:yes stop_codon:yes gene_type:complete